MEIRIEKKMLGEVLLLFLDLQSLDLVVGEKSLEIFLLLNLPPNNTIIKFFSPITSHHHQSESSPVRMLPISAH